MCVALGGRLAEEIINGKDNVTTGASNDFQQCNSLVDSSTVPAELTWFHDVYDYMMSRYVK